MNRYLAKGLFLAVVFLLVLVPLATLALESDVIIRHPGQLPSVDREIDSPLIKSPVPPKSNQVDTKLNRYRVKLRGSTFPQRVDFTPTQKNRYELIKGTVPYSLGQVYLGTERDHYFRSSVAEDGAFTLGPIPTDLDRRVPLYYELTHENVQVVRNDGITVRPIRLRIATIDLRNGVPGNRRYEIGQGNGWKQNALSYFRQFIQERKSSELKKGKNYRIEYIEGLEEIKVRRNGQHYLLPMDNSSD